MFCHWAQLMRTKILWTRMQSCDCEIDFQSIISLYRSTGLPLNSGCARKTNRRRYTERLWSLPSEKCYIPSATSLSTGLSIPPLLLSSLIKTRISSPFTTLLKASRMPKTNSGNFTDNMSLLPDYFCKVGTCKNIPAGNVLFQKTLSLSLSLSDLRIRKYETTCRNIIRY